MTIAADQFIGSNRLPVLASSINQHLTAAEAATRRGLEHAIAAGSLLIEAKELVGHGEWLAWLRDNCHVGARQAQTFMRLARNRHKLKAIKNESAAHLTIAAAEALVGKPKPEQPHGLPGQLDLLGGPEVIAPIPSKVITPTPTPERAISPLSDSNRVHNLIRNLQRVRTAAIRRAEEPSIRTLGEVITVLKKHLAHLYRY
jgi:Protein of unknown function (DUF3102)